MPQTPTINASVQAPPDEVLELVGTARREVRRLGEQVRRTNKALARLEEGVLSQVGIRYINKEVQE